jgi:hypothetical protein
MRIACAVLHGTVLVLLALSAVAAKKSEIAARSSKSTASLTSWTSGVALMRQACAPLWTRCASSPGSPAFETLNCCTPGTVCVAMEGWQWGKFCVYPSPTPSPSPSPACAALWTLCAEAPGSPRTPTRSCCTWGAECKAMEGWPPGKFCITPTPTPVVSKWHPGSSCQAAQRKGLNCLVDEEVLFAGQGILGGPAKVGSSCISTTNSNWMTYPKNCFAGTGDCYELMGVSVGYGPVNLDRVCTPAGNDAGTRTGFSEIGVVPSTKGCGGLNAGKVQSGPVQMLNTVTGNIESFVFCMSFYNSLGGVMTCDPNALAHCAADNPVVAPFTTSSSCPTT